MTLSATLFEDYGADSIQAHMPQVSLLPPSTCERVSSFAILCQDPGSLRLYLA